MMKIYLREFGTNLSQNRRSSLLKTITVYLLFGVCCFSFIQAQTSLDQVKKHLTEQMDKLQLSATDIDGLIITNEYTSKHNGVTHIYLNQTYKGIPISGAVINANIDREGRVLNIGNRFQLDVKSRISTSEPVLQRRVAAQLAYRESLKQDSRERGEDNTDGQETGHKELYFVDDNGAMVTPSPRNLPQNNEKALSPDDKNSDPNMVIDKAISPNPIPVKLVYLPTEDGKIQLAWEVLMETKDARHLWNMTIDAGSGAVLSKQDLVTHDHWPSPADHGKVQGKKQNRSEYTPSFYDPLLTPFKAVPPPIANSYEVYEMPIESPNHAFPPPPADGRTIAVDPADATASPYGWHDIDGNTGAEYTVTRGNNVHAYEDRDANNAPGYNPDGGAQLSFQFPFDPNPQPDGVLNQDASITNLFYWNNIIHDVMYHYGFDEASGNFQVNNYGNGGLGNDDVMAEGQDGGGTNNANFATPPDGFRPRMQMFNWTAPSAPDLFEVNSPSSIAGIYPSELSGFGPEANPGVTADLILVDDEVSPTTDACQPLGNVQYIENFNAVSFPNIPPSLGNLDEDGLDAHPTLQGLFAPPGTPWIGAFLGNNPVSVSTSFFSVPGQADDWMITPAIDLAAGSKLNWFAQSFDPFFPDDYEVRISTTGNAVADFLANPPLTTIIGESVDGMRRTLDLAAAGYSNQTVYLAFRLISSNKFLLVYDDVLVLEPQDLGGKIALIDRGGCPFVTKVSNAELAGAVGAIVINNIPGADPFSMGGAGGVNIPSIMIGYEDGLALKAALKSGAVNVTIEGDRLFFDGDFDNGIIVHEYGHGVSNRLTGGPNEVFCLGNAEQMGEGWSDYLGLMLTMDGDDAGPDGRGIGTFALGQPTSGQGIRPFPYSTDFAINPSTYAGVANSFVYSQPHGIGSIWSQMLWDMTWALIDIKGFDDDLYNGTGGNNIALQLVMDGMKMQVCQPGFVDGRDAILLADQVNNNGAYQCLIWKAFADRGLGYSASQGSSLSRFDGVEAFDMPPGCSCDMQFVLVDSKRNQDIAVISDGDVFDISVLDIDDFTVRAEPVGGPAIGSVKMTGAGENRTENEAPYALAGNGGANYFKARNLDVGTHTIRAYPFPGRNLTGDAMGPCNVTFTIIHTIQEVSSLTLYNADTDVAIGPLNDGDVIDLDAIGTHRLNVEAHVSGSGPIGSVYFDLNNGYYDKTENRASYDLAGRNGLDFSAGAYSLSATSYEKPSRRGVMGTPYTVNFTVIGSGNNREASLVEDNFLKLHPNPASQGLILELESPMNANVDMYIYDMAGKVVKVDTREVILGEQSLRMDIGELPDGIYYLRFDIGEKLYAEKFVKVSE